MLESLKLLRKKYGNEHIRVYKMIYQIVKKYPYYSSSEEFWLKNNGHKLNK